MTHQRIMKGTIMRRLVHAVSRLMATVVLLALLIGVPLAVGRLIGWPAPSVSQLRSTWRTRQIDTDTVIRLGSVIFVLLWAWFAVTALSETARAMRWEARTPGRPMPTLQSGPGDAIRRLVRLAVLSTVSVRLPERHAANGENQCRPGRGDRGVNAGRGTRWHCPRRWARHLRSREG